MLDFDLATLYETETKYLKRAVKANIKRFPPDFMIELTKEEFETLRCSSSTSNQRGGTRYMPYAFTEQGVAMLSAVLKSDKAIDVNISIMRAFVAIRHFALTSAELTNKLTELEQKYDTQFADVYQALNYLVGEKQKQIEFESRKRLGYKPDKI